MHFHIPKPLHGWREFIGEIAVIVLGILIALGAEQIIERAHWQHKSEQTIDAVREDIQGGYLNAVEAATIAPCVDQQLVQLEIALANREFSGAPVYSDGPFKAFVIRAPSRNWGTNVWSVATSEGVVSHLPRSLATSFQFFYSTSSLMEVNARQIDVLSWRLRSLAFPQSADARSRALETIEELRGHIGLMAVGANQMMRKAESIGMAPSPQQIADSNNQSGTIKFCKDHGIAIGKPAP